MKLKELSAAFGSEYSKKLHLGCGPKIIEGFTNIDARAIDDRIHVDNVATLETIKDNSAELIYACHVLEHFGRHEFKAVLQCWYNKLQIGGTLRLSVPDIRKAAGLYLSGEYTIDQMYGFIYGGQAHEYDYHKVGFDHAHLRLSLAEVGFKHKNIRNWNWETTEHSEYDDYSQAYLPHMNKSAGIMMSVNIEAVK